MDKNRSKHSDPASLKAGSEESSLHWLRGTTQLDVMHTTLRNQTALLLHDLNSDQAKAIAVHNFVQRMPFVCHSDSLNLTASDVLKRGGGDCFSKGILMVTMLRIAKIPARLRFVSLPTHFLRGVADIGEASILHAMTQVHLHKRWVTTDSYVTDAALFDAASDKLYHERRNLGYGIHRLGDKRWNGSKDASSQCVRQDASSQPLQDWGVADDPQGFLSQKSNKHLRRNFFTQLKWRVGAGVVNKRVAALRHDPS